ncbi:aminoglycoside phosphotransferase family protein [Microlunatus speluncae]|uniref:aminoglycoside phosphotransferase family protein n=1 Tax=Microlunatus speluncae TaxID=2594267 RepID=UPI0012663183|nr:aminoglycoside phosphotransferase family protein [Microlunatus speluncae]
MVTRFADGRGGIDTELARRLIKAQFPQWADLPVTPVEFDGWDNRTFRLGDDKSIRIPSAAGYAAAVEKEDRWLPRLASGLPVPIPEPVGLGRPTEDYPHHWSVRRWLDGETASPATVRDQAPFADDLARFLLALQAIDPTDGPAAGDHCAHRGAPPVHYDDETREALRMLRGRVDTEAAERVWEAALAAPASGPAVWFHGDVSVGNLLVRDGRLAAVIDFGTCGVGDPACDLVIAWTFLSGAGRRVFRQGIDQDHGTWARARGWAIWKALIVLARVIDSDPEQAAKFQREITEVIDDHREFG